MNKGEFKVTIPSLDEMQEMANYCAKNAVKRSIVPDFAMVKGAKCIDYFLAKDKYVCMGPTWTRNVGSQDAQKITVVEQSLEQRGLTVTECPVDDAAISVMPRFQNPKANGFGWTNLQGNRVLTINDQIAYWPQKRSATFVNDELDDQLYAHGIKINLRIMSAKYNCYHYQGKNHIVVSHSSNKAKMLKLFDDDDAEYLHFADGQLCHSFVPAAPKMTYCFEFEPIRVMPCADGSIQCLDGLFPSVLGTKFMALQHLPSMPGKKFNLDGFTLGNYLNNEFVTILQKSTELLMVKLRALNLSRFGKTQDREI